VYWLSQLNESRILADVAGSMHIVPADDIIQSRTFQCRLPFVLPEVAYERESEYGAFAVSFKPLLKESREITFGSDTSPPQS
jgi:hypothetical protein